MKKTIMQFAIQLAGSAVNGRFTLFVIKEYFALILLKKINVLKVDAGDRKAILKNKASHISPPFPKPFNKKKN